MKGTRLFETVFAAALFATCLASCASVGKALSAAAAPCAIYDSQIAERECVGIEFTFANLSGKEIQSVKIFARIQSGADFSSDDYSGADFSDDAMEKEFTFAAQMSAGDAEKIFFPFDEFSFDDDIENYYIESLFASQVLFVDGAVWHDAAGRKGF